MSVQNSYADTTRWPRVATPLPLPRRRMAERSVNNVTVDTTARPAQNLRSTTVERHRRQYVV